ncbi:MAG: preprotein translocase subunit YajC [Elusimicrobiaceae bacterium]|nr:preprotein translocase subunit YajC [Elusimicrobiaceae bacterium]
MNTAAQGGGANMFLMLFFAAAIIFMLMSGRGQKKREEQRQAKIAALQKGDQVIIPGGIVGTVVGFKDNTLEVKIAEGVKITILKSGIVGFISDATPVTKQGGAN